MATQHFSSVEDYISHFPEEVQATLETLRKVIQEAAPEATEAIVYGIPTFKFYGNLVHFGAYPTHIGFYPSPSGIDAFQEELKPFLGGKGTIKFPLDMTLPFELITQVVKFRVKENSEKKK